MIRKSISNRAFSLWTFAAGIEGMLVLFLITREPSEAGSALVFGLSLQRLAIAAGVFLLSSFFVIVAVAHAYRVFTWNEWLNNRPQISRYFLTSAFILEFVVLFLTFLVPDYRFPTLSAYLTRLKPVLVWLAFLLAQTFVFLAYYGYLSLVEVQDWRGMKPAVIVLIILGSIWGLVAVTGIGIIPDELYWNVAGVPLLAGQIWLAIGVTLIVWFLYERFVASKGLNRLFSFAIFIGIWAIAAVAWIKTPLASTFNAPGPYLPAREFYPFVDAALFDLGAQSAVYGKGLFFGGFIDRGLLSGFLALIHRTFGQDYLVVVGVQTAVYAVFPALLYSLGKKVHSISAGILIAALAIFKVSNAISGGRLISTSHPKLMLTEFPTGIVLVLITVFLVRWLNSSKAHNLSAVGASIGVGILLRHNVLFMFPAMLITGLAVWGRRWKLALRDVSLVIVAFFIAISPWMWRNQMVAGEPFFFLLHFNQVIEERYQPESHLEQDRLASGISPRALRTHTVVSGIKRSNINMLDLDQYQFISKHFVHNLIASVLVLPPSPVLDDFRHIVDDYPYWGRMGDASLGDISGSMSLFLAVNLIILALGIGSAWKRVRFAALVPLMVFLFYNLANAFARTSGGRYIVPVDWVIYVYYAIGLIEILRFCISTLGFHVNSFFEKVADSRPEPGKDGLNWSSAGLFILPFFLIVASLPVLELASPGAGPPETTESLLARLDKNSFYETSGFSRHELEQFLSSRDAILITGRGLYPRYYSYDQGEPILPGQITAYTSREFPRLVFTLLLPTTDRPVVFPIDEPKLSFPDAAEVIVGGCQVGQSAVLSSYLNFIDAAFVVILDEPVRVYIRVPEAPLACPLREPVCDNNHNCN